MEKLLCQLKLFTVSWSPHGSNQRELEEAVILGWTEYVNGIGGIIIVTVKPALVTCIIIEIGMSIIFVMSMCYTINAPTV